MSTADRIAEATLRLFNQKGYPSTTLTEIAADEGHQLRHAMRGKPGERHP